jgi:hypothetical protein
MACANNVGWCKGPAGPGPKCLQCQKGISATPAKPVSGPPLPPKPGGTVQTTATSRAVGQIPKPPVPVIGKAATPPLAKLPVQQPKLPVQQPKLPAQQPKLPAQQVTLPAEASGYKWLGGGMDKGYYYKAGSKFGWLEFKEASVLKREVEAYTSLKAHLSEYLPQLDSTSPPPANVTNQKNQVVQPVRGYWIEHIPHQKTLKPKMMTMEASPQAKAIVKGLGEDQRKALQQSLLAIQKNLSLISQRAGELSIAVNQLTGRAYLLDYAPNQLGQVGGPDLESTAKVGLGKLLALVSS